MSGQNPNVFYEVGFAHAKGKLCIVLTSEAPDIPFDLKHRRHIDIRWAQEEIEKQHTSHIKITQQFEGVLTNNSWSATGEIAFKIDFQNTSNDRAVNIQAIYFYSTKVWTLFQDEKECPETAPEPEYGQVGWEKRHFLHPPLQWLQKGGWAQLKFKARRILAVTFEGEEIKSHYTIRGRSLLCICTPDGNFDYEIPVNVTVDDIPF